MDGPLPLPRPATRSDVATLVPLWAALLREHAAIDAVLGVEDPAPAALARTIQALVGDAGARVWLAEHGATPLGFCAVRFEAAPPAIAEAGRATITELFVGANGRRRGLGRVLAEAALAWAKERGAARVEVRVAARNAAGQAFWRALGFGDFVDVLDRRL